MTDEKNCGGCGGCDHDDDRCDKECDRDCEHEEEDEDKADNALKEHDRLSKLYKEDIFAFEAEKQQIVDEFIMSSPESQRKGLMEFQKSWDDKMKYAGSDKKRFELAQTEFWKYVGNEFLPALNSLIDNTEEVVEELKDN